MADSKYFSPEDNKQILLAAINSLAGTSFANKDDMSRKTIARALTIQQFLRDDGPEMRTLDSVRIYAHIDSVEFEESSKRYLVRFTANIKDAEQEYIRTPRMDTRAGRLIEDAVKNAAGHMALIYKNNEPAPEDAKGKNAPSQGFRVMPWIEVFKD